jgi:phosphoglycerate dehydrogenase-like enzyme
MTTVLYPEGTDFYPDDKVEREILGPDVKIIQRGVQSIAELSDADCAEADGLLTFRLAMARKDFPRFPRLKAMVRMGVGYDIFDRAASAERNIMVCNVPDYGTTEVADMAMAHVLALRRGVALYFDTQRGDKPAGWEQIQSPLVRRLSVQRFGIIGLGRIGTAVALRAKAFGFQVCCYDPYRPPGWERAVGIDRVHTLEALLKQSDVISVHCPLTPETRGMVGLEQMRMMPRDAILVNTARGPIVDMPSVATVLREGHLAGVGLDVIPVEPVPEPVPELIRAYRAREPWLLGRLIVTPHVAFHSPQAWDDIRSKSAETIKAALLTNRPQNVIPPDSF